MAGIYLHIPFCHRRCHYCDFYTSVNFTHLEIFYHSLLKEIELRKDFFSKNTSVDTIYFGGGTPSVLNVRAIENILNVLYKNFSINSRMEITIEVNPEDVSEEYYKQLRKIGINRLSIGIQSFSDEILKFLNRRHGAEHSHLSIKWALNAGFENISIDLIYGIPILSREKWEETLNCAIEYPITHISSYHLTVEPGTTFGHLKNKGKFEEMDEEDSWKQLEYLHILLENNGFEHYEISNFSKPHFRSKHNTSYWQEETYLGLGPSAHSFNGEVRFENIKDIKQYVELIKEEKAFFFEDVLSERDKMNEFIMLRLRCKEGMNKKLFLERFGVERLEELMRKIYKYYPQFLEKVDDRINLNLKGWFISDTIFSDLFF